MTEDDTLAALLRSPPAGAPRDDGFTDRVMDRVRRRARRRRAVFAGAAVLGITASAIGAWTLPALPIGLDARTAVALLLLIGLSGLIVAGTEALPAGGRGSLSRW